jgi:transposase-like protein
MSGETEAAAKAAEWHFRNVFVPLVQCPNCGGINHRVTGSWPTSQHGAERKQCRTCKDCGHKFQVFFERHSMG